MNDDKWARSQVPIYSKLGLPLFVVLISALSVLYCHHAGILNLHYDGVARLNIARRVLDHVVPHYSHLGTVWLPLPQCLMLPLVQNDFLWYSGLAGSLISALAFCTACACLYELSTTLHNSTDAGALTAWAFALNPNILYLQSTPLSEMLYVALFLAALLSLLRYNTSLSRRALAASAAAVLLASLTRYDGWALAPLVASNIFAVCVRRRRGFRKSIAEALVFLLPVASGIAGWLLYNRIAFGSPFAFLTGPHATRNNINRIVAEAGLSAYPPFQSSVKAVEYYLEAVRLAAGSWVVVAGFAGFLYLAWRHRLSPKAWILWLCFLVPPSFYIANMVQGTGIIYVPGLPPHGILNVRYTSLFLPALCLCLPSALELLHRIAAGAATAGAEQDSNRPLLRKYAWSLRLLLFAGLLLSGSWKVLSGREGVAFYHEAWVNGFERRQADFGAAAFLREKYDGKRILMDLGHHGIIPQQARVPLIQFLSEVTDWGSALARPSSFVQWIVVQEGDGASRLNWEDVNEQFDKVFTAESPFEAPLRIYKKKGPGTQFQDLRDEQALSDPGRGYSSTNLLNSFDCSSRPACS